MLRALAARRQNDTRRAHELIERALQLAEPEGYVRVFLDEGRPMQALLRAAVGLPGGPRYAGAILEAFAKGSSTTEMQADLLTDRELGVLILWTTDLSGPDLARELVVSLNTLRTHIKSIYSKLGVSDRCAAVRRGLARVAATSPRLTVHSGAQLSS